MSLLDDNLENESTLRIYENCIKKYFKLRYNLNNIYIIHDYDSYSDPSCIEIYLNTNPMDDGKIRVALVNLKYKYKYHYDSGWNFIRNINYGSIFLDDVIRITQ
jgi:hypothetical protein